MATSRTEFFSKPALRRPSRPPILRPIFTPTKLWRPAILVREGVRGSGRQMQHHSGMGHIQDVVVVIRRPIPRALSYRVNHVRAASIAGELPRLIKSISR